MEKFSVEEVIQVAISMEEEGVKFYEEYAKKAEGSLKEVMLALAEDEKRHAEVFKKMFKEIQDKNDDSYLFNDTVVDFFGSYTKSKGFNREQQEITNVSDAIRIGAETEGITINYYQSLLEHASNDELKNVLERLIKEEQKHKKQLEELL